jgi:cell shape-determining protein MreD
VAKKKKRKTGFITILLYLGIVFTGILFMVKLVFKSVSWLDVFAPLLITFFIIFLLSVVKTAVKKV